LSQKDTQIESLEPASVFGEFPELSEEELRRRRELTFSRFRLVWDHRGLLLRVFVWSLLICGIGVLLIPNRYEAVERLMPPDSESGGLGAAALSALSGHGGAGIGAIAGDLLGMKNSGALFIGILQSRTVQDRLIDSFQLQKVYGDRKLEDTRQDLAKRTSLGEDRKSGIISIGVTDHDPKRAAEMARAYVSELDRLVSEVSTSSARRERIFLEERLRAVKGELDTAAQKFSEFASKNTAIDIPAQGKAMVEAAATLQGQLIAAESELSGLEAIYTDQNVRVRSLRARVGELRAQLGKLGGEADPSAATIAAKKDPSSYPTIRELPVLGVTYANLFRQTKIEETVYELLTQQYELAKVQEAKEIPSVKVLDAAIVPTKKSFPPRLLLAALGTALAVAGAIVWLFTRRYWDAMDPQDPGKRFAIEVVQNLRDDSRRLAPAIAAVSHLMFWRKSKEEAATPPEAAKTSDPATKKTFTRAAGQGAE